MQRILFATLLICLIMLSHQPLHAVQAHLSGIIRNLENHQAIVNAEVIVGEAVDYTDENGEYRVKLPLTGRFVVEVNSPQYHQAYKNLAIHHGVNHLNFELTPKRAESLVFGTVFDRNLCRPLGKVEVSLDGVRVRTNQDGHFSFRNVEQGDRWLTAVAAGYKVTAKQVTVDTRKEKIDIFLIPDGEVSIVKGKILDRVTSLPISLAVIRIADLRCVTDNQGNFSLETLQPGEHRIEIKGDGYLRYQNMISVEAGTTDLTIYLEVFDRERELQLLRNQQHDPSSGDWKTESMHRTVIDQKVPAENTVRKRSLTVQQEDLRERTAKRMKLYKKIQHQDGDDRFIRGEIHAPNTGEYIGFVSFILNLRTRKISNVSLRAEPNEADLLLTHAKYQFTRRGKNLLFTLTLDNTVGYQEIKINNVVQNFDLFLHQGQLNQSR